MKTSKISLIMVILFWLPIVAGSTVFAKEQEKELTISEAVETALSANLNLRLRQQALEYASGSAFAAQGNFDTLLRAGGKNEKQRKTPLMLEGATDEQIQEWNVGLSRRFTPGTEVDISWNQYRSDSDSAMNAINPYHNSSLVLSLSQPLLRDRGEEMQMAEIEAAKKEQQAATFLVRNEAADLAAQVKKGYWELVFARQEIEVIQLSLDLAIKLLAETREKINAGILAPVEVYQPESEVARRRQLLISAERAIGVAGDNLKLLLNYKDWQISLIPLDRPELSQEAPDLQQVMDNALANRADLGAARLQVESADIIARRADGLTLPDLALEGAVGLGGTGESYGDSFDRLTGDTDSMWRVGLRFSVPLGNQYARGRLQQANASLRQARTRAELLQQDIRRTVRGAVRDVNLTKKAVEATELTTLASLKRLEGEQSKFDAGTATTFDVLVAQEAYSRSLADEYRARVLHAQSLAELDRIQGLVVILN